MIKNTGLRTERTKNGLSQEELAEQSGVNVRTIRAYEYGTRNLTKIETIKKLAEALQCDFSDLV